VHNPPTLQVAALGALVSIAVFGVRGVELLRAHYAHEARACIGEEEAQLIWIDRTAVRSSLLSLYGPNLSVRAKKVARRLTSAFLLIRAVVVHEGFNGGHVI
jgi:hypothetical protein